MKLFSWIIVLFISLPFVVTAQKKKGTKKLIDYVNPMIGTERMGHVYPGATYPFGMVQLTPSTNDQPYFDEKGRYNKRTYEYCSGYQYEDSTIFGFYHTAFSGTGHSDLGDFLMMPTTGELTLDPGVSGEHNGYHSTFSHKNEVSEPGYYQVKLDKYNIVSEFTTTKRVGFHRYTFPKSDNAHIILDLMANIYNYDRKNVWTFVRMENDSTITGYRQTAGWGRTRTVYFAFKFSKPFKNYGHKVYNAPGYNGFWPGGNKNYPEMAARDMKLYFDFETSEGEEVLVKFAMSPVSTNGAVMNLNTELSGWDFDKVKEETQAVWEKELSKITAQCIDGNDQESFYTSLYHTMLGPIIYSDVDGSYKGIDQNIYKAEDFTNYTIFSIWDTYRTLHPLFNVIQTKRNADIVNSMIAHYDQSVHNMLPIWSHYANENWCMTGYHSVSVVADAVLKDIPGIDIERALDACVQTSNCDYYAGIGEYKKYGYHPYEAGGASVTKTLEYAYDDWCIAQLAKKAGKDELYDEYMKRSKSYENTYDAVIGYMRPKGRDGKFRKEFDIWSTHGQGFIEGNAWNYSLYVPQDVDNMVRLMGGPEQFSLHLDSLFTVELDGKYYAHTEDVTKDGLLGNYNHGNEPAHHIPYLFNWTNTPYKTQYWVRKVLKEMYENKTDGLCGNDDAGQMSAWYIMSSLGFYPVCPGSNEYALGSPAVVNATINLENGKKFKVETTGQSHKNVYVQKVELNGKTLDRDFIKYEEVMNGGELKFYMGRKPNTNWGI